MRRIERILQSNIDVLGWDDAISRIIDWGSRHESRMVAICNVHVVVTASQDADYQSVINGADMATADGAPVAWALRRMGWPDQQRINGPDLMWRYLREAERKGQVVSFYGGSQTTLDRLENAMRQSFPALRLGCLISPPFRPLSAEEDQSDVDSINRADTNVLFVGLGCPKQERWMADHKGRIHAVMVGVGAAFDYHAGTLKRAPLWMRNAGLEWLHRLFSEPRRLWKRYAVTNSIYIVKVMLPLIIKTGRNR